MSKRLSDDEKRYFTDQISMLKGENERLTKYIEDYKDDTRKVLADECAPDEVHCTCVPILRAENKALIDIFRSIRQDFTFVEEDEWQCRFCDAYGTKRGTLVEHKPNCPSDVVDALLTR